MLREETKFHKLFQFGKVLPVLRAGIEKDMAKKELCQEKVGTGRKFNGTHVYPDWK